MSMPPLTEKEIRYILHAADPLIAQGGKTLLTKMLKGSKEKKIFEFGLDQYKGYGFYKGMKWEEVQKKINWMIRHDFLETEKFGRLPLLVFTDRGWLVQSDQYADELIEEWEVWLLEGKINPDMTYLKDRNRRMILLMLEKIKERGKRDYIPYLQLWEEIDYKKVRAEIQKTIRVLEGEESFNDTILRERKEQVSKALAGAPWYDVMSNEK
ncbi:RQC-minor-1 family DNA-binding protein [Salimicrobium flavidum]|uniref:RQC domain-containing protein n=1 Tax=Salimicrobium flavidum TaxID=570947 RepID=A0A1N7JJP6_9BACI|nr:RQC-minor-1 family DNA-binding protein [Salimicrobium flavidum]SIS49545.1 RQC domain-containing protein [Salimicrobium flavidum]